MSVCFVQRGRLLSDALLLAGEGGGEGRTSLCGLGAARPHLRRSRLQVRERGTAGAGLAGSAAGESPYPGASG